jgi:outer membrane receptor for Fe3+-dicitrate
MSKMLLKIQKYNKTIEKSKATLVNKWQYTRVHNITSKEHRFQSICLFRQRYLNYLRVLREIP